MATEMKLITDITLELTGETKRYEVVAKQGDKATRFIRITLKNNGQDFEIPAGMKVIANIQKPDRKCCYNTCAYSGSTVTMELTNQALAVAGTAECDIEIRDANDEVVLSSQAFTIEIEKSMRDENAIRSSNEFTQLEQDVREYAAEYLEKNPVKPTPIDKTLTQENEAADAKITGEAIGSLEDNIEKVNKHIEETWKDVIIGELFEDESDRVSELPYREEGLDTYINFAYYPDGFPGKFGDLSENNTDVITNGTDLYTSGRNGMVDGKFMVNGGPLSNSAGSRIAIESEAIHAYPFSVEMYVHLRRNYNPYAGNNVLTYENTGALQNHQCTLFSTQYNSSDGPVTTNGVKVMINKENVAISGSANSPNVSKNVQGLEIDGIQNENIGDRYDHIVVCFDSNKQKFYLNNELIIDNDEKSVSLTMSSVLRILPDQLKGDIKLIRIYEGMLSDEDVEMNYLNAVGGTEDEI